jgi:hypothetical protein
LIVGPPDYDTCRKDLEKIMVLFKDIDIPIKEANTVLPCTLLTFLGIELDSVLMEKRLPKENLEKIRALLSTYKKKKNIYHLERTSVYCRPVKLCLFSNNTRPPLFKKID